MRCRQFSGFGLLVLGVVSLTWAGVVRPTQAAGNVDAEAHRTRLVLEKSPDNAVDVLTVRKQMVNSKRQTGTAKPREVVVTGQIGGMPNVWPDSHPDFPWYEGQASFFLVDSKVASQFAAHAKQHGGGHQCTFCKSLAAKNAHAIAVVNFVDKDGKILRFDARELADLKENQTVMIRGNAKLLAGSMLVIDADGIFIR
jgi:hypothetical protein